MTPLTALERAVRNANTLQWFNGLPETERYAIVCSRALSLQCPAEEVDETFTLAEELDWLHDWRTL